jgi:hypothetical protein
MVSVAILEVRVATQVFSETLNQSRSRERHREGVMFSIRNSVANLTLFLRILNPSYSLVSRRELGERLRNVLAEWGNNQ